MTKEEFLIHLEEDEEYSPGWQAIDDAFEKLYPGQIPDHFGTIMTARAIMGGDQYLDGCSIYSSPKGYKHLGYNGKFPTRQKQSWVIIV